MESSPISSLLYLCACMSVWILRVDANSNCSYSATNDSLYCTISQLRTIRTVSSHSSGPISSLSLSCGMPSNYHSTYVLTNAMMKGLERLTWLDLNDCYSLHINTAALQDLLSLHQLNLAHNKLSSLHQDTFKSLKKLKILRLDDNKLKDINGLLQSQTELKKLNVSSNRLQWFDYAFIPKSLEMIDLHNNQIEELGNYFKLKDEFNLHTMDVSQNKIQKISSSSFLASLQHINLQSNDIQYIDANTFTQLLHLSSVRLDNNHLVTLHLPSLATHPSLHTPPNFYLSDNPLLCDCHMDYLAKMDQHTQTGHYPSIEDIDSITCSTINTNNITYNKLQRLLDIPAHHFLCEYQAHCFALCQCCDFVACDCRMQCPDDCTCLHDSAWKHNVITCSHRLHTSAPHSIPMDATDVYLDGNNLGNFTSQAFIGRRKVTSLFLNSSKILSVGNKTFNGLTGLKVLHLESNLISRFQGVEFDNLTELQELYLHNNRIQSIGKDTFQTLLKLKVLSLYNNLLSDYPVWKLTSLPSLSQLSVAQNNWPCDCHTVRQLQMLTVLSDTNLFCHTESGKTVSIGHVSNLTVCTESPVSQTVADSFPDSDSLVLPVTVCIITAVTLCIITVAMLLLVFRTQVKIWLHSHYNIRLSNSVHGDCIYDAFVSYSIQDEEYIQQIFVPNLNCHYQQQYRLCLQHRDLTPGSSLSDQWPALQSLCSKVIMVLSRSFLTNQWEQIELLTKSKCIIILLEDLTSLDLASVPKLNFVLQQNTVLRWNQSGFWNNLRYFLPDPRRSETLLGNKIGTMGAMPVSTLSTGHRLIRPRTNGKHAQMEWVYDYTDSSTSTRSTGIGSGSPRSNPAVAVMNTEWSDNSEYGYTIHSNPAEHLYAHIPDLVNADHLYHTVESHPPHSQQQEDQQHVVGNVLEVMLPSGDIVPATLVRNNKTGRVIPLVSVSPAPGSPVHQDDRLPSREPIKSRYTNR